MNGGTIPYAWIDNDIIAIGLMPTRASAHHPNGDGLGAIFIYMPMPSRRPACGAPRGDVHIPRPGHRGHTSQHRPSIHNGKKLYSPAGGLFSGVVLDVDVDEDGGTSCVASDPLRK